MAYSYVNYTGDGSKAGPFSVPFPYLDRNHVHFYVQGLEVSDLVEWLSDSTINLPSTLLEGEILSIVRITTRDARLVVYQDGSLLDEATLNLDSTQLFYVMQEAIDTLGRATDLESAVYTSKQAILDAITGSIARSQLTQDLLTRITYADRWYEADEIIENMSDYVEPVYFMTPLQWGIAQIGVNSDNISALVTSVDGAWAEINVQAGLITQIATDVEGNAGVIALLANEWYVKLDGNGRVAGVGLYNSEEESQFVILADKFAIVKPDGSGSVQVPFIVDTTTSTVGVNGNLLVTGSVTLGKLAADSVVASNINVSTLSAIAANLGTITAGTIRSTNWGTSAGCEILLNAGTFRFGGSSNPAFSWDGTDIDIDTGGVINVQSGGSIILQGDDTLPGFLQFDSAYTTVRMGYDTYVNLFTIEPTADDDVTFSLGGTGYANEWFRTAYFQARDSVGLRCSNTTASDYGGFWVSLTGQYARSYISNKSNGSTRNLYFEYTDSTGWRWAPGNDNVVRLGDSSYRWTAVYAVNGTIQTSDARDKEHISDLNLGLAFINRLRPVNYCWLGETEIRQGLIAQEVEEAAGGHPLSAVHYDPHVDRYGLNYAELVTPIIKAIQELTAKVESLEEEIYG